MVNLTLHMSYLLGKTTFQCHRVVIPGKRHATGHNRGANNHGYAVTILKQESNKICNSPLTWLFPWLFLHIAVSSSVVLGWNHQTWSAMTKQAASKHHNSAVTTTLLIMVIQLKNVGRSEQFAAESWPGEWLAFEGIAIPLGLCQGDKHTVVCTKNRYATAMPNVRKPAATRLLAIQVTHNH